MRYKEIVEVESETLASIAGILNKTEFHAHAEDLLEISECHKELGNFYGDFENVINLLKDRREHYLATSDLNKANGLQEAIKELNKIEIIY